MDATMNGAHSEFRSTTRGGLNHESPPMKLYRKALKLGMWDPGDIDLRCDTAMDVAEKSKRR